MTDRNIEAIHPLTPLQEGILYHTLDDATPGVYFNQFCCTLTGPLDEETLRRCWQDAVARHAPLRTLFTWEKRSQPLQIVRHRVELPWQSLDWRDVPAGERATRLDAWLARDRDRGFALDRAPLIRLALIRLEDRRWRLAWSFHHIILDGWSVRLILDEVLQSYRARRDGRSGELPEAPPYGSFLQWLDERDDTRDEGFWRQRLAGFESPTTPHVVLTGPGAGGAPGPSRLTSRTVAAGVTSRLSELARASRVTVASTVAAAWALVLARYCDTGDVVFGTTVAGRPPDLAGADRMAGLFINTLPLRVAIEAGESVATLCQRVMRTQGEQREFEQTPLQSIRRWSEVDGPLFETILVFENLPAPEPADGADMRATDPRFIEYSNFPLALLAVPGEALELIAVHQPAHYSTDAAERLLAHVEHVLEQFASGADMRVGDVSVTTPADRAWLAETLSRAVASEPGPGVETVVDWFERCVDVAPDSIAVATTAGDVSYGELDARANRIANALLRDDAAGEPVIVCSERNADAFAAMLGALKAGRPYVPLEADAAGARLRQVIDDLRRVHGDDRAPVVLTQRDAVERAAAAGGRPVAIDDDGTGARIDRPGDRPGPDSTAYVIYTSGSTGEPKGVVVSHANLLNSTRARLAFYDQAPATYALLSSLATDSAIAGIYWTLCTGGTLTIPGDRAELDVAALAAMIAERNVTHLLCVPSLYALLLEHGDAALLRPLAVAIVAGEACDTTLVARHFATLPNARLYNEYGPSEACVWASAAELMPGDVDSGVTIGAPVAGTRLYVLDRAGRRVPPGVAGELYIGGRNVARGYLGRPELTERAFVPDPFAADGSRMYRTGDRVRVRADGRLDFIGRVDQQIKVRGFRVEPGEIEAALAAHPTVENAAAFLEAAAENDPGPAPRKLVAVVTPAAGATPDAAALRRHCHDRLPDHMVPQVIAVEAALPRTAAGKVDRRALERRRWSTAVPAATASSAPATATEQALAAIWAEVLGVERVGTEDNFFEIGGDSLLTIRILSRAAKAGLTLTPAAFFAEPTVAAQARAADAASPAVTERGPVTGPLPLSPIQHWFFDTIRTDPQHWNQSVLLQLEPAVSRAHVERAVQALLLQHDALRARFPLTDGQRRADIADVPAALPIEFVDARDAAGERLDSLVADVAARLNGDFDLAVAPLLRCAHFATAGVEPDRLLLVIHHLVVDAESWRLVLADLGTVLRQLGAGGSPALPRRTSSIRTWAKRLSDYAASADAAPHRQYWSGALPDAIPPLPRDVARGDGTDSEADALTLTTALDAPATARLAGPARTALRADLFELIATAFARALADWCDPSLVVFDTEGHGREPLFDDVDVSRTVGWFTTAYPIVLRIADPAAWDDPATAVRVVREQVRAIPQRGIGFGILRELARDDALRAAPRPAVMFNFLGIADPDDDGPVRVVDERCGPARSPACELAYALEANARIVDGRLSIEWRFSGRYFRAATIERLAERCMGALHDIAAIADGGDDRPASPGEFLDSGIDQAQLDTVAAQLAALDDD